MSDDDAKVAGLLRSWIDGEKDAVDEWAMVTGAESLIERLEAMLAAKNADIARLTAEVERLTPAWTWESPKAVGWYRARSKAARGMPLGAKQYAIFISDLDIYRQPDEWKDYQWAGPFPEPLEPDQKPA